MRLTIAALLVLTACVGRSEEPLIDYSSLWKVPNLSPLLTAEDVSKEFTPWAERIRNLSAGFKAETALILTEARMALRSKLPRVSGLTLYSLFPIDAPNLKPYHTERAEELEELSRFHDFPILGQVSIDDSDQANRWVDFFRDQIIPGSFLLCEFAPRHGFRLSTANGNVDILMCYSCGQLAYFGSSKLDQEHNPIFSSATEAQLNRLFDKLKIKRDVPPKK